MTTTPTITCVTITRDHSASLPNLLHSVRTFADSVVVFDCGSSDGTDYIAREFDAHVVGIPDQDLEDVSHQIQSEIDTDYILIIPPIYALEIAKPSAVKKQLADASADVFFLPDYCLNNPLDYLPRPSLWKKTDQPIPSGLLQTVITAEPVYEGLIDIHHTQFLSQPGIRLRSKTGQRTMIHSRWEMIAASLKKDARDSQTFMDGIMYLTVLDQPQRKRELLDKAIEWLTGEDPSDLVQTWQTSGILGLFVQSLLDNNLDPGDSFESLEKLQSNLLPDIRFISGLGYLYWKRGEAEKALKSWMEAIYLGLRSVWTTTTFFESVVDPFTGLINALYDRQEDESLINITTQIQQTANKYHVDLKPLFVSLNHSHPDLLQYLEEKLKNRIETIKENDQ